MILNQCSICFSRKILDDTPSIENPVTIHMSGINSTLMRHLLVFLYSGQAYIEVSICIYPLQFYIIRGIL